MKKKLAMLLAATMLVTLFTGCGAGGKEDKGELNLYTWDGMFPQEILDGFEKGINDKARERAIVVHGANYADPAVLKGQQRLGRSLGCPALPPDISKQVIDTIKGGVLLYIYGLNKA